MNIGTSLPNWASTPTSGPPPTTFQAPVATIIGNGEGDTVQLFREPTSTDTRGKDWRLLFPNRPEEATAPRPSVPSSSTNDVRGKDWRLLYAAPPILAKPLPRP